MMGLIDHKQVPAGLQGLLKPRRLPGEQVESAEQQLIVQEGVAAWICFLKGLAARLVKDVKPEIEATQQFQEPLVHQGFRHQDNYPPYAAGEQQPVEDETSLDGLPQAYLVRKQDSRHDPPCHLCSDAELMREEIDPTAQKAAQL